jgi:DNA-binding CsgD family transcriptional regulator
VRAGPDARKSELVLIWFVCTDEFEHARARHRQEHEWFTQRGLEDWQAERLAFLSLVDLRSGRWETAARASEASYAVLEQFEPRGPFALARSFRSLVDAHQGRTERALATLEPLVAEARRHGSDFWEAWLLSTLAFAEFAAGDHAAVDRSLTRMIQLAEATGKKDDCFDRSEPFYIESLLALGHLDRARQCLARLEERDRMLPRLWIDATLPRARALVLEAQDDPAAAVAALDELDVSRASQLPFELGWHWLVKGRLLRRLKQRRAAAAVLHDALEIFEQLGAPSWGEQARRELARVAPRRHAPDELTPTELRVAELAAKGLTNRDVAKAAFMSAKTVEANLARVYRKLEIRSRAELGAKMLGRAGRADAET